MAKAEIMFSVDSSEVSRKARVIAKHLTALADELETPDSIVTLDSEMTEEQARAFTDDHDFERKLQHLMRVHPQVLETWIRKRDRIHGGRPLGHL